MWLATVWQQPPTAEAPLLHPPVGIVPEADAVLGAGPGLGDGVIGLAGIGIHADRQAAARFQIFNQAGHQMGRHAVHADHLQVRMVFRKGLGAVPDVVALPGMGVVPAGKADPVVRPQLLGQVGFQQRLLQRRLGLDEQDVGPGFHNSSIRRAWNWRSTSLDTP